MRSFRSKPTGWRYESHRHSLAARGYASRRYKVSVEGTASFLRGLFDDGKPKTEDFEDMNRKQVVAETYDEVTRKLRAAEEKEEMYGPNSDRFLKNEFTTETKDYLDKTTDRATYQANVRRKLDNHMKIHCRKLKLFGGD